MTQSEAWLFTFVEATSIATDLIAMHVDDLSERQEDRIKIRHESIIPPVLLAFFRGGGLPLPELCESVVRVG